MSTSPKWTVGDKASLSHTVTEDDVKAFVDLSGDDNPLHIDETYARGTLAGGRVVHGMLTASFISTLIGTKIPGPGALWNRFSVDWKRMVRIGDTLDFYAEVTNLHRERMSLAISVKRDGEEVLFATAEVELMGGVAVARSASRSSVKTESGDSMYNPGTGSGQATANPGAKSSQTPANNPNKKSGEMPTVLSARSGETPAILITGASGSIGQILSRRLLEKGQNPLILWGRQIEELKALASGRPESRVEGVDLSDFGSLQTALASIASVKIGGIVHIAAPPLKAIPASDARNLDALDLHLKVGLMAFSRICQHLRPNMAKGCSIVALSSQYTLGMPPENTSAYVCAKLALEGYIRALAVEWGPQGIRANLIAPSLINTPYARNLSPRMKMVEEARNPLKRLCHESDVCDSLEYLLSPASSFVNGVTLPLTGGLAR